MTHPHNTFATASGLQTFADPSRFPVFFWNLSSISPRPGAELRKTTDRNSTDAAIRDAMPSHRIVRLTVARRTHTNSFQRARGLRT